MTKERWLSYQRAWVAIAVDLDISLSKAERLIFDAFEAEVRVRVHKNGIAMVIPSDWWHDAEIGGFEIRLPDGTTTNRDEIDVNAYDLSELVDEVKRTPDPPLKKTSAAQIRNEIGAVYDDADASGQGWPCLRRRDGDRHEQRRWLPGPRRHPMVGYHQGVAGGSFRFCRAVGKPMTLTNSARSRRARHDVDKLPALSSRHRFLASSEGGDAVTELLIEFARDRWRQLR